MSDKSLTTAIAVAVYTIAIIIVGILKSRQQGHSDVDYYLANRSLKAWVSAFSGAASAESGWVLLGLVGTSYTTGISALWLIPGCLAGYLFNWLILAPKLHSFSHKHNVITIPEVLYIKSGRSEYINIISSLIILVFMTAYVASQFNAVGKTLNAMFDLSYIAGVWIGAGIVFSYVIAGGFKASVWTDFPQAALMVGVLVVFPIMGAIFYDGSIVDVIGKDNKLLDWTSGHSGMASIGFIFGWVGIGLGYPGQPHVLVRFMATENTKELYRAGLIATIWSMLVFFGAIASGLVARAWLPNLTDPEQALPIFAMALLPAPIAGLVLAAILAAICSTADSQLLVASSTLTNDLFKFKNNNSSFNRKIVVTIVGLIAALFASTKNRIIFDFVLYAWAVLGASIGTAIIALFFFKRISIISLIVGMLSGAMTVFIWKQVEYLSSSLYELIPAFFISLLSMILVESFIKSKDN